jgi:TatD DNase family protein
MVETDCPYLAPEPLRGTINQPKNVWLTAQKIADNLQMPLTKFEKMAVENTKRFYNIK